MNKAGLRHSGRPDIATDPGRGLPFRLFDAVNNEAQFGIGFAEFVN